MKVINSVPQMQAVSHQLRQQGQIIALVPTMGFLHEGHLSLIRLARQNTGFVIVSIFVNPTQFGPTEDFERYPRDTARDEQLCRNENVDIVFYPDSAEMYPADYKTYIITEKLAGKLCGINRPDHFRGVTTIVAKLFNIVKPQIAVFGQKDAQQAIIIKRMVADLNFDIDLKMAPIVREHDGLALSSRNKYLNDQQRKQAIVLSQALKIAGEMIASGENKIIVIREEMINFINSAHLVELEYLEFVNYDDLEPVEQIVNNTLIAIAARIAETRLIDNIIIKK